MSKDLLRVSLMIRRDQHVTLRAMEVNISGYIRDLIDDRLSDHTVIFSVESETKAIYDQIISNTGEADRDFEPYIRDALKGMLADKIKELQEIHKTM